MDTIKKDKNENSTSEYRKAMIDNRKKTNNRDKYTKTRVKDKKDVKINDKKVEKKERKNKVLKTKKEKKRTKTIKNMLTKDIFSIILLLIVFIISLTILMYRYSIIANIRYDINEVNMNIQEIEKEIKVQKTKIEEASRSDIIEKKAIEDFGMVYRSQEQLEYVSVE